MRRQLSYISRRGGRNFLGRLGDAFLSDGLATLAAGAGFSADQIPTAVAIAMAESGGNPVAYNPEKQVNAPAGKGSFGLWQIFLARHPEFAGQNLFDPATNAAAAFSVFSREGWTAWSTFKSGAYQKYLSAAPAAPGTPLTIDNATGQAIDDSTPTPGAPGSIVPASSTAPNYLLLTAAGFGAYLLADLIFGE